MLLKSWNHKRRSDRPAAAESADKAKPTEGKDGRSCDAELLYTDMAFSRETLVAGTESDNIYDISAKAPPS